MFPTAPRSGKGGRVAAPPSPKNRPYTFQRKRLKPLANQEQNPFGAIVGDKLDAGALGSLPCLSRYSLVELHDGFPVFRHCAGVRHIEGSATFGFLLLDVASTL